MTERIMIRKSTALLFFLFLFQTMLARQNSIPVLAGNDDGDFKVSVMQGYQTTGCGNSADPLLRIDVLIGENPVVLTKIRATLKGRTAANVRRIGVYLTEGTEFFAEKAVKVAEVSRLSSELKIPVKLKLDKNVHLWLTACVKDNATLADSIDAALTGIDYRSEGRKKTYDATTVGDPAGSAKIFATQSIVFAPTEDNCRFYRIPALMLDKEGNLVALADRRYQSNADLGNHRIDVTAKRSLDGGRTWSRQYVVAEGDGTNKVTFGYGDASLARTKSGRLICLMATGANNFFSAEGIKWVTMTTSDDNGMTWSRPSLITDNAFGFQSVFVSSGKGLTTKDGTILFTTNIIKGGQLDCHILRSKDEGQTWELLPEVAFAKADESKMEQLSNGQIFLSVRRQGDRGFNVAANADGTGWRTSWTNSQISGNACNADVLSYGLSADGKNDILIHSYVKSPYRENLTLAISRDSGKTWKDFLNIQKGGAAYSTMQLLPNGDIAVFYEDESYSAGNGYAQTFVVVTKDQIK